MQSAAQQGNVQRLFQVSPLEWQARYKASRESTQLTPGAGVAPATRGQRDRRTRRRRQPARD